jgi:hypothetical protein
MANVSPKFYSNRRSLPQTEIDCNLHASIDTSASDSFNLTVFNVCHKAEDKGQRFRIRMSESEVVKLIESLQFILQRNK